MKVFTCNDHDGFWPVGTATVVVAADEQSAREMMDEALKVHGLTPGTGHLIEMPVEPGVRILCDGNY